jgi:putative protease
MAFKGNSIPIDLEISMEDDIPLLTAKINGKASVSLKAGFKMQKAKNQPLTIEQIENQMRRTGGTPFVVRNIKINYQEDLFAPLGELNSLRRNMLEAAEEAILEKLRPRQSSVDRSRAYLSDFRLSMRQHNPRASIPTLAVYADSLETIRGAIQGGCKRIYYEPNIGPDKSRHSSIIGMFRAAKSICENIELVWKWPKIAGIQFPGIFKSIIQKIDVDGIMIENVGDIEEVLAAGSEIKLFGAAGLNVYNSLCAKQLSPPLQRVTISPELSLFQLREAIMRIQEFQQPIQTELVVQGNLEVAVAEDCVPDLVKTKAGQNTIWGLQDMRRIFPLRVDGCSRTHIYNSAETCLVDKMPDIFLAGLDGIALDARGRTERYAKELTEIYIKALQITTDGRENVRADLANLKERIRPLSFGGITYGHFVKGLKDEIE